MGYRYRANTFDNFNYWYPFAEDILSFYDPIMFFDVKWYNFDVYQAPYENKKLAEFFFRFEID